MPGNIDNTGSDRDPASEVAMQTLLILQARRRKMREQDLYELTRLIQMVDGELGFGVKIPHREDGRSWWWSAISSSCIYPFGPMFRAG